MQIYDFKVRRESAMDDPGVRVRFAALVETAHSYLFGLRVPDGPDEN